MIRNQIYRRFVIFFGPRRTRFIANDGARTCDRLKAAKFYTLSQAIAFAEQKEITLSHRIYIEQEEFSEAEVT
jgi:hypothetical protein